ncbi:MAG: hypothetical protein QOG80_2359 [Pseudonocardiales bacterium]|nr:hypothetical protein [Pseudonocardiales bacterium]
MTTTHSAVVTLPTDLSVMIARDFDAPRHLVFRSWTEPELIKQWWHANRGSIVLIEVDLRVGGAWRYLMTATAGFEVGFHGEFVEIVPDERLVTTEYYEGAPGTEPAVTTTTFTDLGDRRTRVELLVEHANRANRDMHVESGMEDGLQDALDMVEQVAASLTEA